MTTNNRPIFLVDVDDTLLDNQAFKHDLFAQYGQALGFSPDTLHHQIWSLYYQFRTLQGRGAFSFADFGRYLIAQPEYATKREAVQTVIDNMNVEPYLLPETKKLLEDLAKLGQVVIWTRGTEEGQRLKLAHTGLDNMLPGAKIFVGRDGPLDPEIFTASYALLIDPYKGNQTRNRLREFLERNPAANVYYIDNSPKQIELAREMHESRLKALWVNQGDHKVETEERQALEEEHYLFSYTDLKAVVSDINKWTKVEDALNPGSPETPQTPPDLSLK